MKMIVLVASFLCVNAAWANLNLAQKNNCLACHSVDNKMVGPSFKEVAKAYQGKSSAEPLLISKVKAGGVGVWGNVPMPPNSQISSADSETLVQWILTLK
ncbi:MAG: c-type cytochrome [Neisseriaceae bacterium]|nr:c-type cytochrome [Neisseriaceae bacterium]